MKTKDIRELTDGEIVARIKEDKELLLKMKFNHTISSIENPSKIRQLRRTIARMNTILTERLKKNNNN
jgi:large subunit ribosomal protein L29